jgi:hypothetical protein
VQVIDPGMKYLITFKKRFTETGEEGDDPSDLVSPADGVILDKVFVERSEPPNRHVTEDANESGEDDGFLTFGTESWIYEIDDSRTDEFLHELRNSRLVLEFQEMEDEELIGPRP